jgi:hypothetical protein
MAPPQGFQLYDERARAKSTRQFFRGSVIDDLICGYDPLRPQAQDHFEELRFDNVADYRSDFS